MVVCYNCGGNHFARNCPTGLGDPRTNSYRYNYLRAMKKMSFVHPQTEPIGNSCFRMEIQEEDEHQQQGQQQQNIEQILKNLKNMKF